ncbi:MAG: tetratricopeptide repeat protein [Planctomycetota bacterium]
MSTEAPATQSRYAAPLSTAARQRLQKVFEHAQRCVDVQDYDYGNRLFTQCLVEDPCNLVYLQNFMLNLQKKYEDNKRGGRLASLKIKSQRSTLNKAVSKGEWEEALTAACSALTLNPWDIPTLLALASAYEQLRSDECELYCMRCALNADSKDVDVNRQAGKSLQRMGQFDQAIACWQRVKQELPQDDEARQSIARLSVEQTIDKGGYDPTMLDNSEGSAAESISVAQLSKDSAPLDDRPVEVRLKEALQAEPTEADHYLQLADLYLRGNRFDEAERVLAEGSSACGAGNLELRSRNEDVQLRRVAHLSTLAQQRYEQDPTEEALQLAHRYRVQANQVELEIYAARSERDPKNTRLRVELGLRLKRAGKVKEAITAFQAAKTDTRRGGAVLVELGECFQHIEQYKLALSHYEQALEAIDEPADEIYRKALYRAGVLSTGMEEYDRAEHHLSALAALDFGYRDVADRLDKLAGLRDSG